MYNTADKVSRIFPVEVNGVKCKACKNSVPDGSVFCNFCGERLVKTKREKTKEISVPKAKQLPSGTWFIEMQIAGKRHSVSAATEAECTTKARAQKAGLIEEQKRARAGVSLREAIDRYIASRSEVLSPSTVRGYRCIQRSRFRQVMDAPVESITNWQQVINAEAKLVSAKTLKNSWLLIASVLREVDVSIPTIKLPLIPKAPRPWLDHAQIPLFLAAIRGQPCELAALLGLHSLRRSEIYALRGKDIDLERNIITVSNSVVVDENDKLTQKQTAKNETSQRIVPIMIPALAELLPEAILAAGDGPLVRGYPTAGYKQINRICEASGLPKIGFHGLRHSFASLAQHLGLSERETMEIGGWSDHATMHTRYTHLSQLDRAKAESKMSEYYKQLQNPNGSPNEK